MTYRLMYLILLTLLGYGQDADGKVEHVVDTVVGHSREEAWWVLDRRGREGEASEEQEINVQLVHLLEDVLQEFKVHSHFPSSRVNELNQSDLTVLPEIIPGNPFVLTCMTSVRSLRVLCSL